MFCFLLQTEFVLVSFTTPDMSVFLTRWSQNAFNEWSPCLRRDMMAYLFSEVITWESNLISKK